MKHRLKHVDRFEDRNGATRYYFRKGHGPRVALPGAPGSADFLAAYQQALAAEGKPVEARQKGEPGTIGRLVEDYLASTDFLTMKPATRGAYQKVLLRWVDAENVAHRRVSQMTSEHVNRMIAKRAATPGAANDLLKKIRMLMNFAIRAKLRTDNPAVGHKRFKSGEHHTWLDVEIAAFEGKWSRASKERLAFALHLFTGQRTSDVCRMSWADIDAKGLIRVVQQKTGAKIWIPMHRDLRAILLNTPRSHHALLTTAYSKPFSTKGLGNWMAHAINAAGLPDECVTHGLRKAAARRLAEAGCSAMEVASITGHKSLEEVERYVREASQRKLALAAMRRLEEHQDNENSQTEAEIWETGPETNDKSTA